MSPRRLSVLAVCGTVVLAGWVAAGLGGLGSPGIENTGAPIEDSRATSVTAPPSSSTHCKQPQWARIGVSGADAAAVAAVPGMPASRSQMRRPALRPGCSRR